LVEVSRRRSDEAKGAAAPLAERPLEARLAARRREAAALRGACRGERTSRAAGDPRQADGRAEIHERMRGGWTEPRPGPLDDPSRIRVDGEDGVAEREPGHGVRRVPADARELAEILGPAVGGDTARGLVEVHCAAVVSEPLPCANDVSAR